jgi:hypothetical protein
MIDLEDFEGLVELYDEATMTEFLAVLETPSDEAIGELEDDDDPDVAYNLGFEAAPDRECPYEPGTIACAYWHDGTAAADLAAMQRGEVADRYRDPDL